MSLVLTGCDDLFKKSNDTEDNGGTGGTSGGGTGGTGGGGGGGTNSNNPIQLVYNTWADGVIVTSSGGGEQWFKFTATEASQVIHVSLGTLTSIYVQVYDSSGSTVGSEVGLYGSWGGDRISRTLAAGQEYKIKVRPVSSSSNGGTYKIGFTNSSTLPRLPFPVSTQLSAAAWTNGNITSSGEEWFKFTATASTQYIHVVWGTLTSLYIQVYDSNGIAVGSDESMSNLNISRTLTTGQVYYIRTSGGSGTYQIAFNDTSMPPVISTPTPLNAGSWTAGVILTSSSKVQWFSFIATSQQQYIHVSLGTLTSIYIQVYDSSGSTVGSEVGLYGSWGGDRISRTLVIGQEYKIRVRPVSSSSDGTYKITFNDSTTPPAGG